MNPSEHLAFELEEEKVRLNKKIILYQDVLTDDKDKQFVIDETIRKLRAQIEAIDKEIERRNNKWNILIRLLVALL